MDKKILFYGYGNPGRQDDALGIRFIERMETWVEENGYKNIFFDSNYQLNIEDADNISHFDVVIFVDATVNADEAPFSFSIIDPAKEITFTTHSMSPQSVVALCEDVSDKVPDAYILAIPGYEWEMLVEGLSRKAEVNLEEAYNFIFSLVKEPDIDRFKAAAR